MEGEKFNEEDVSRLQKRKTIFKVDKALPYITNRIEVISETEVSFVHFFFFFILSIFFKKKLKQKQ